MNDDVSLHCVVCILNDKVISDVHPFYLLFSMVNEHLRKQSSKRRKYGNAINHGRIFVTNKESRK